MAAPILHATLKDVAAATGFAETTIAAVLNGRKSCYASARTRAVIRAAAERLQYKPNYFARSLRQRRSFVIGVAAPIFGCDTEVDQIVGLTLRLAEHGYMPLFADTNNQAGRERNVLGEFYQKRVDGIIFRPADKSEVAAEGIVPDSLPMVLITTRPQPDHRCLVVDYAAPFDQAVRRLVELGHREIGFHASPLESSNRAKLEGYRRAMESHAVFDADLMTESCGAPGATRKFVVAHEEHFRKLTAVFATNDQYAREILSGLAQLGIRVPHDCSVIGYDDSDIATAITPALTTIRQPRQEVSEHATNMIMRLIGGVEVKDVLLPLELVERETTGPCGRIRPEKAVRERSTVSAGWEKECVRADV